ncbi:Non-histone chromosomal protein HMG-14, partial [Lemmus lemmus]
ASLREAVGQACPCQGGREAEKGRGKKISHQIKKVQAKGKRGTKGKQAEVADQQTTDLPAEKERLKTRVQPLK